MRQWGAVEEITGYTPADFGEIDGLWMDIIFEEDREYFRRSLHELEQSGNVELPVEYRIVKKDGMIRRVVGVIKKSTDNEAIYSGYLLDMTSRNNFHTEELYREELLQLLNSSIYTLFDSETDEDESIDLLLEQLANITKTDRVYFFQTRKFNNDRPILDNTHEWCGEGIAPQKDELQDVDFKEIAPRWYSLMLGNREPVVGRIRLFPQNEKDFLEPQGILSLLVIPVFEAANFAGFIGFDDCTTERLWSREEITLLTLYASLLASSRMYRKAMKEMRDSVRNMLKIRNEREKFFRMLSHQFKTPLSVIDMNTELLQLQSDQFFSGRPELFFAYVGRIHRSSQKLRALIDSVLTGGAHEHFSLVDEYFKPLYVIQKYIHKNELLGGKMIEVESTLTEEVELHLPVSISLFEYILDTLLSNAIKYSIDSDNPVEVWCGIEKERLVLKVKDYGIGIPGEEIDKVASPFYRGSNTEQTEGTGLGLSMVRSSLQQIGGKMEIDSIENSHTSVVVMIPLI